MQTDMAQVSMRCDQAVGHARETGRDVDRLRDELREELAAPSLALRFATKHEVTELSELLHGSLRGCEAGLQELRDVQERIMQRPRPANQEALHRGVSQEDLAEVTEQLRRESVELISQKHDGGNQVSKQELGRNVHSIMEELERLTDRVGNNERARQDMGDPRKDIKRLFEQLNIIKDQHERTLDEHQDLTGSFSQLEARLSQDFVPKDEFKGAIHAVMDELIQAQKFGMSTRDDLDTLAKAVETLRMRNGLLGEEVKKRMDALDGGVQSLKQDLVGAIAELRRRASKEEKPRAADAALVAKAASEPLPGVDAHRDRLAPLLESRLEKFRQEITEAHALLKEEVLELREKVSADFDGFRKDLSRGAKQNASRQEVLDVGDMFRQELKVFADRVQELDNELHSQPKEEMKMSLQSLREELKAEIGQVRELESARRDAKGESSALPASEDTRQSVGTSLESIREAVEIAGRESQAARNDCADLRQTINVLTARAITDRSMVTAGIAAAMAMSDRNSGKQHADSGPQQKAADVAQPQTADSNVEQDPDLERAAVKMQRLFRKSHFQKQPQALPEQEGDTAAAAQETPEKASSITTQMTERISAGTTVVPVADTTGFAVGDPIVISSSAGTEVNEVAGFSSIRLRFPTRYDHPVGTTLTKLLPGDPQLQESTVPALALGRQEEQESAAGAKKLEQKEAERSTADAKTLEQGEQRPVDLAAKPEEEEEEEEETDDEEDSHSGFSSDDVAERKVAGTKEGRPKINSQSTEDGGEKGKLQLTIVGATGLGKDDEGESLVYCVCKPYGAGPAWCYETPAVSKVDDPTWNASHDEESYAVGQALEFAVWEKLVDEEEGGDVARDCCGKFVLQTSQFYPNGFDNELLLTGTDDDVSITLRVQIVLVGFEGLLPEVIETPSDPREAAGAEELQEMDTPESPNTSEKRTSARLSLLAKSVVKQFRRSVSIT